MAKKRLDACRDAKDFIGYAKSRGAVIENCSKGVKIYPADGRRDEYALIHSNHPRELATGTRWTLIKKLTAIGLALIPLACLLSAVLT